LSLSLADFPILDIVEATGCRINAVIIAQAGDIAMGHIQQSWLVQRQSRRILLPGL